MGGPLVDAGRIDIFERWRSQTAVETFRGFGPSEKDAAILSASLAEYDIADLRALS